MIYVFFGTDVIETRRKAQEFYTQKKTDAVSITRFIPNKWRAEDMEAAIGSTSLFGETDIFVIDSPEEQPDMKTYVYAHMEDFATSPNIFVLIEGSLRAPEKKKVQKYATEVTESVLPKEAAFNIFGLADALLRKDKKSLWILYTQAKMAGHASEEISGTLFWQVKMLALAHRTQSADEAGVSAFPYNKAKRALSAHSKESVQEMLTSLVTLYHKGHGGEGDMDTLLEEWILTV